MSEVRPVRPSAKAVAGASSPGVATAPAAPGAWRLPPPEPAGPETLRQIFLLDYSSPVEITARLVLVAIAGTATTLYTGQDWGLIWAAAYIGLHALHRLFLSTRRGPERRWEVVVGHLGYGLINLVYVTLPTALLVTRDPALVASAALGLAAMVVFLLWRPAPPRSLLPIDILLHGGVVVVVIWHVFPMLDAPLAQALLMACALAEFGYFAMALRATTAVRHRLSDAAQRATEAQKMEAMGRLTGGIAHDFNNNLTVLRGNLELYAEVTDEEERRKLVAEAHAAALRASALVGQLLSFARPAPPSPVSTDAGAVVVELARMAARTTPAGISIVPQVPLDAMPLHVDTDRLNAALLNLVINARDALGTAGRIVIEAAPADPGADPDLPHTLAPGRYLRLSVVDDGPGLSPETARRALEPFYTTKGVGEGTGLGLPSAKAFAEQSGGTLTIRSRPGETAVSLYLPRAAP
ncbi:sensor histidine kinase [Roseicyclus persicicus]|uniref:histidine kinase n=1 Tax=Roseicyclus persicicus TaxID=2650661 RepID=A0A7X6JYH4_9RHOB|nr:ATP-binding protein [Roseibacterium persicicum]NKX45825.1 hypothetical protein [Roseibacterium persicicum]